MDEPTSAIKVVGAHAPVELEEITCIGSKPIRKDLKEIESEKGHGVKMKGETDSQHPKFKAKQRLVRWPRSQIRTGKPNKNNHGGLQLTRTYVLDRNGGTFRSASSG